jgi:hypothetical protein
MNQRTKERIKSVMKELPIDKVVCNSWNPNVMDEKEFNLLVKNVQEIGMAVPITVVEKKDGTYMIIGGEHRWKAARLTGEKTIPAVVYREADISDDFVRFQTMRLNMIHGKIDPKKFIDMYNSLSSRYSEEVLKESMGFLNQAEWDRLLSKVKAGLPNKDLKERFEQVKEQIKTMEDLSTVLNRLFTEYGSTLPYAFMIFDFGGKENLWVRMDKPLFSTMKMIANECVLNKVTLDAVLNEVLIMAFNRKEEVAEVLKKLPKAKIPGGVQWPTEAEVQKAKPAAN